MKQHRMVRSKLTRISSNNMHPKVPQEKLIGIKYSKGTLNGSGCLLHRSYFPSPNKKITVKDIRICFRHTEAQQKI